jgi:hypothetical protein
LGDPASPQSRIRQFPHDPFHRSSGCRMRDARDVSA